MYLCVYVCVWYVYVYIQFFGLFVSEHVCELCHLHVWRPKVNAGNQFP